ncbi:ABC transporter ATP-binding protein [Achromobacter xylosoxidans]|uniref:ABC transporter ATP-binding protein n=1 Tax=Achromobacter TaxID=222 RepID=UPI0003D65EFB|nr:MULTISPECIES: ABC transporter ATP-binding protein [Achromobacter]AHC50033.1 ABC transporter ATP-binding protein [Achromobacter xylosoxidans NBRC 15126 = ATCC 27061]AUZ19012.1 polyamine ABC transporter ATP-binding protein [Achromobacter xylosoxidans]KMJ90907.1 spermidine/putrescine ABC transporter ATP-binding protein [Achromobacter xylosoxidans]KOQ30436.1 spermidine/putrescine ABC transporter ATP-binding protein [Achromobacter xylosoxidans]KOQ32173.1 spermidine/putrescine ABC transporter ATP
MSSSNLQISGLGKRYGDFVALAPTHLDVARGEFLTLLGPSGSGKTTLLSLIAGLARPDEGRVLIDGNDVTHGAPYERDIGMVFQNYALFPHMTILENIAFPLKMRKVPAAEAKRRAQEALDMVRLPQVGARLPRELSGGQQQRIALARCMVYRPAIILMDEPLGALDKKLRDQMQLEIKRIHRELGTTIVYVTHDQEEAMTMSDRICLMNGGAIEQLGTPADLYFRPRTLFVADFLGESNLLQGEVTAVDGATLTVRLAHQGVSGQALSNGATVKVGQKVTLMLRPQNLQAGPAEAHGRALTGKLLDVMVTGSLTKLYLDSGAPDSAPLVVAYPTRRQAEQYAIGQPLSVTWQAADAVAIAE